MIQNVLIQNKRTKCRFKHSNILSYIRSEIFDRCFTCLITTNSHAITYISTSNFWLLPCNHVDQFCFLTQSCSVVPHNLSHCSSFDYFSYCHICILYDFSLLVGRKQFSIWSVVNTPECTLLILTGKVCLWGWFQQTNVLFSLSFMKTVDAVTHYSLPPAKGSLTHTTTTKGTNDA